MLRRPFLRRGCGTVRVAPGWCATASSRRAMSVPSPSDLFTSPGGLMALFYGRSGSARVTATSAAGVENNREGEGNGGRTTRHRRGRDRASSGIPFRSASAAAAAEAGTSSLSSAPATDDKGGGFRSYLSREAVGLAVVIFALSAVWELFNTNRGTIAQKVKAFFITTLEVRSSQEEFAMIVDWMGRQPHGQRARNISLKPVTVLDEDVATTSSREDERAAFVPGYGSHFFTFGSTWMWITRSEDQSKQRGASPHRLDRENDILTISLFTRQRGVVQDFLAAVRQSWTVNVQNKVQIFVIGCYDSRWRPLTERTRRPLSTLYLPPATKAVVEEARLFFSLRDTYALLGIPWRRGYLLEGPPGTGKSSFVVGLAGELQLPIYLLSLQSEDMSDDFLLSAVSMLPRRCILLIEDFENAIKASSLQASSSPTSTGAVAAPASTEVGGGKETGVSLSALLNALDGVASSEGRLLVITSNDVSRIPSPEALLRPGRVDRRVRFEPLQPQQMAEMQHSFVTALQHSESVPQTIHAAVAELEMAKSTATTAEPVTPAVFQEALLDSIYTTLQRERTSSENGANM